MSKITEEAGKEIAAKLKAEGIAAGKKEEDWCERCAEFHDDGSGKTTGRRLMIEAWTKLRAMLGDKAAMEEAISDFAVKDPARAARMQARLDEEGKSLREVFSLDSEAVRTIDALVNIDGGFALMSLLLITLMEQSPDFCDTIIRNTGPRTKAYMLMNLITAPRVRVESMSLDQLMDQLFGHDDEADGDGDESVKES